MKEIAAFKGFSKATIKFFRDLRDHNDRAWFDANRDVFESEVMAPSRAYIEAMGVRLKTAIPRIVAIPKVNKSIFKINRDTRFSLDPSPYKTNLGLYLWEGPRPRLESAGFYLHLEPPDLMIGGGMYIIPDKLLSQFRRAALHPKLGHELIAILKEMAARGYEASGRHYKRIPPGFDATHPNAPLLLHNGLYTGWEGKIPSEFYSEAFLDFSYKKFEPIIPLHRWLMKVLT